MVLRYNFDNFIPATRKFYQKRLWGGQRAVILNVSGSLSNYSTEAYSIPGQTSIMEVFMKIVNGFRLLSIFAKIYILDS